MPRNLHYDIAVTVKTFIGFIFIGNCQFTGIINIEVNLLLAVNAESIELFSIFPLNSYVDGI